MPGFLYQLPKNIIRCFKGYNLLWHLLAIVLTCIIVTSGFDWYYFISSQKSILRTLFFPAVRLGMILPITVPLILLAAGVLRKDFKWFSEFVAGAVIGSLIGAVVGKSFKRRRSSVEP
jgi:hypothetical protein